MMNAELIVVKLNTVAHTGNRFEGPLGIWTDKDFRSTIQHHFDTLLRGIQGYILVMFNGRLFQCERDNTNPEKPYIRHEIKYHPVAKEFTCQKTA